MLIIPAFALAAGSSSDTTATLVAAVVAYDKGDHAQASQIALDLAETGNLAAQYLLGSVAANQGAPFSNQGLPDQQAVDATAWLEKAAHQGYIPAMRDLGHLNLLYRASRNPGQAAKWYEMAATRGDAEAQQLLGLLQLFGFGLPKNETSAFTWLSLSAKRTQNKELRGLSLSLLKSLRGKFGEEQFGKAEQIASEWLPMSGSEPPESVRTDIRSIEKARENRTTKQEVETQKHMASLPQLRFGQIVGIVLGLDPVFGALLYTSGGLIGKN